MLSIQLHYNESGVRLEEDECGNMTGCLDSAEGCSRVQVNTWRAEETLGQALPFSLLQGLWLPPLLGRIDTLLVLLSLSNPLTK